MGGFSSEDLQAMHLPTEVIEANKRLEAFEQQSQAGVDDSGSDDGNTDGDGSPAAPAAADTDTAPKGQDQGDQEEEGSGDDQGQDKGKELPKSGDQEQPGGIEKAKEKSDQPEAKPTEAEKTEDDTWRQRYRSLQGKYNAEVPRLRADVNALRRENQELKERQAASGKGPKAGEQGNTQGDEDIDLGSFADYGEEIQGLVRLVKTERARRVQMEQRMEQMGQTQSTSVESQYMTDLYTLVGEDLSAKNQDAGFLNWLNEADPLSGRTRRELLNEAAEERDAIRVSTFFHTYFDDSKQPPSPEPKPANPKPAEDQDKAVERQVSPGKSKAEAPPQAQDQYTREDHGALAKKITTGRYPFTFKGKQVATHKDAERLLDRMGAQLLKSASA